MTNLSGYNAWAKNTIKQEGIVSFVLCPIPDKSPPNTCQRMLPSPEPMHGIARDKLTNVLMTVILNLMTEGAPV